MNVAIIGSRDYPHASLIRRYVYLLPRDTVVISGAARGADSLAAKFARERGMKVIECPAQWNKYGKGAGFRRNHDIIKAADYVIAFWNPLGSKGTAHSIELCKMYGKSLEVIP